MSRKLILTMLFITTVFVAIGEIDSLTRFQPVIHIDNNIPVSKYSNTLIGLTEKLIPLMGVFLGFLLGVMKEYFAKKREINSNGQGWTECFIQIEDSIQKQIIEIEDFLEKNPENTYELTDFTFHEALDGAEFEDYDQKHLSSYLKKKNNLKQKDAIKLAGKLKATMRIVQSNQLKLKSFFSLLTENTNPHFQEFKTSLTAFRKVMAEYIDEILNSNSTHEQQAIAEKIVELLNVEIHNSIRIGEPINAFKFSEKFIQPFFELAVYDRFHPKMKLAIDLLSQCDHSIMAMKMERRFLKIKLGKIRSALGNNLSKVTELIAKI